MASDTASHFALKTPLEENSYEAAPDGIAVKSMKRSFSAHPQGRLAPAAPVGCFGLAFSSRSLKISLPNVFKT